MSLAQDEAGIAGLGVAVHVSFLAVRVEETGQGARTGAPARQDEVKVKGRVMQVLPYPASGSCADMQGLCMFSIQASRVGHMPYSLSPKPHRRTVADEAQVGAGAMTALRTLQGTGGRVIMRCTTS